MHLWNDKVKADAGAVLVFFTENGTTRSDSIPWRSDAVLKKISSCPQRRELKGNNKDCRSSLRNFGDDYCSAEMSSIRIRRQNAKTASDTSTGELQDCQTGNEILPKRNGAGREINANSKQIHQKVS